MRQTQSRALAAALLVSALVAVGVTWWRGARQASTAAETLDVTLANGVHVTVKAAAGVDGPLAELTASLPRDPDLLLASARSESYPQVPRTVRVEDDRGELRRFIRARARALSEARPPVVVIGWDGADPRVVEDLLAAGLMRNLRVLRERGAWGRLRSHAPFLSPLLWTSIATGKRPEEHGILDFVEPAEQGSVVPIGSSCRRSTTLWEIASDLGRKVLVVNWWATDPSPRVNGQVVSDRWIREPGRAGGPDSRLRVEASDPAVTAVMKKLVRGKGEDLRIASLRSFVAEALTTQRVLLNGLQGERPDFVLGYFGIPDQAGHLFVQEMPPHTPPISADAFAAFGGVVHGCYLLLDALLGELLAQMPEDAAVVLVSDHGFVYGSERLRAHSQTDPRTDALHSPEGIYLISGPSIITGEGETLDLHEVAPMVLTLLGIPPARDMAKQVPVNFFRQAAPATVPTHEVILDPPQLGLLDGEGCGGEFAPVSPESQEELQKLATLGYLAGRPGAAPVLPLANYGRSLLDAGRMTEAAVALEEAAARRPEDAWLGFLVVEALIGARPPDARRIEATARRYLYGPDRVVRSEFAFVLVELFLSDGRTEEAQRLAQEVGEVDVFSALSATLVAAWTGERELARREALRAAGLDPVRAVDTIQAFGEIFARDLGVVDLVATIAEVVPLDEILRAPVGALTDNPEPTRIAASAATDRVSPTRADFLWRRRARATQERMAHSKLVTAHGGERSATANRP